ncbi:MAG TPA: translation initiation factor IF-3 [Candidatus Paceibacterota bacterium]|nr:translation initiation factor IF-3 [Candidatus Pacearchaeota archaeon]HRZ51352.1 translation initiation factor IF-3 [Candidatus Paceibacterota bacterium]HSA37074.1 translation initiation factor IF-3 [Candidatus Paceibacterota bacterium]
MFKKPLVNNQIRASQVRLIDETDRQIGVVTLKEALESAWAKNLDLVQVTEKTVPPVVKITEYGKYLYALQKKDKSPKRTSEVKGIRLSYNISLHDMEMRAAQAEKFLKKGDKVKIELRLRGREKAFGNLSKEKVGQFLDMLQKLVPCKIDKELKREQHGFTMIISKQA